MNKILVSKELVKISKLLMGMEFPTQDALDKYLKEHPDADQSRHRVVDKDMSMHPMNLLQKRKNENKINDIAKHLNKKPQDLTNKDIEDFNTRHDTDDAGFEVEHKNQDASRRARRPIQVFCPHCHKLFDEKDCDCDNIEEDMQGRDVVHCYCPKCKKDFKSRRFG